MFTAVPGVIEKHNGSDKILGAIIGLAVTGFILVLLIIGFLFMKSVLIDWTLSFNNLIERGLYSITSFNFSMVNSKYRITRGGTVNSNSWINSRYISSPKHLELTRCCCI